METHFAPWINRELANSIYEMILTKPAGIHIYWIEAPAGVGKTYLLRDIGSRLGSPAGYEPGNTDGIYWSGIVDLHETQATSSTYVENLWINAFGSMAGFEFDGYMREVDALKSLAEGVRLPSELEKGIELLRSAFVDGMAICTREHYPVMAFDTVEILEAKLDSAQREPTFQLTELSEIFDWLLYQIEHLPRGIILMVGRPSVTYPRIIESEISAINSKRNARGQEPASITRAQLTFLSETEQSDFVMQRLKIYPELNHLLDYDLKVLLAKHTRGNPLLLDIAIQTLLETRKPDAIKDALQKHNGMSTVVELLLSNYLNSGSAELPLVLSYLVIAENGLSDEMLEFLVGDHFPKLRDELERMASLPFVKARENIVFFEERTGFQRIYSLHDEMYAICNRVGLILMGQLREESAKIAKWYDYQIEKYTDKSKLSENRYSEIIQNLMVESLLYRIRFDPLGAYGWFLEQSDWAIRVGQRSLDMRLHDSMAQFISGSNPLDREILDLDLPFAQKDFLIDSTILWLKRYAVRGQHEKALQLAQHATWVKEIFESSPDRYLISYAEFRLWLGQCLAGKGQSRDALAIYKQTLEDIKSKVTLAELERWIEDQKTVARDISYSCFITGRLYNDRGNVYLNNGKYWLALVEFLEAIRYFKLTKLDEEIANTKDNMGIAYARLGFSFQAFQEITESLNLSITIGSLYREALSRSSLSIIHSQFSNLAKAHDESENSLQIFERFYIERGIALAHYTRGIAFRHQAWESELWENPLLISEKATALMYIESAETDFRRALRIYSEGVDDERRQVQALKELGCCDQVRYLLLSKEEQKMQEVFTHGKRHFDAAVDMSNRFGMLIDQINCIQDRIILYVYADKYDLAKLDIELVCRLIPDQYQFKKTQGLPVLGKDEQRTDAFYDLMGKTELLIALASYEEDKFASHTTDSPEVLLEIFEHYFLAAAYFNAFSSEAFLQNQLNKRVYIRLRNCPHQFILAIQNECLPAWIRKYRVRDEPIRSQFDGIFSTIFATAPLLGDSSMINNYEHAVYVSYAWGGESERIVDELVLAFANRGIQIVRDKKDLSYKGSIDAFEREIGQGKCVVLVISNKYLRSRHCMYELIKIGENPEFRKRVFPIILEDAHIFEGIERINYVKYWDDEITRLNDDIKLKINVMSNISAIQSELNKYVDIRNNFDYLAGLLSDMNALTPELHEKNGFSTLISAVESALVDR
jgi:tetratricopeptide (TPR) repeat protein